MGGRPVADRKPKAVNNLQSVPEKRGWTRQPDSEQAFDHGFPAHAGMDPGAALPCLVSLRLPRTRGDGPVTVTQKRDGQPASPHTRGWTPGRALHARRRCGFPAHAGMDPDQAGRLPPHHGLPRTRGDGPSWSPGARNSKAASPHTRGWTLGSRGFPIADSGFPAHAGMDPVGRVCARTNSRLPRTRGDGPAKTQIIARFDEASPHTRGWTPIVARPLGDVTGFPAHAGMDPVVARRRCACMARDP